MQALIQAVQQKLLSALAEAEELDHVYMCRSVQAVAELARVSLSQQRWTAESSGRKEERRREEEEIVMSKDIHDTCLNPLLWIDLAKVNTATTRFRRSSQTGRITRR